MNISFRSANSLFRRAAPAALILLASIGLHAQQPTLLSSNTDAAAPSTAVSTKLIGQITVRPDHTVNGSIRISGLVPSTAQIHESRAGADGPTIIALTKTAEDTFSVPPDSKLTETQFSSYMAGDLYVSVLSAQAPNTEIRATLLGS